MVKYRYYAVEFTQQSGMRQRSLINIYEDTTLITAEKLFWGVQHLSHTNTLKDMVVLKDYGTSGDRAYNRYDIDFPPQPVNLDTWTMAMDIRGWLAPDGRLFYAEYMNHSGLADDLVRGYRIKSKTFRHPEDRLYSRGWVMIGMVVTMNNGYGQKRNRKPTPAQVAVLRQLHDLNTTFQHYQRSINNFFALFCRN